MDNTNQQKSGGMMIHESQIPSGEITPLHLAATATVAKGDLYYVDSTGHFARLPIGTEGQTLKVVGGKPAWA